MEEQTRDPQVVVISEEVDNPLHSANNRPRADSNCSSSGSPTLGGSLSTTGSHAFTDLTSSVVSHHQSNADYDDSEKKAKAQRSKKGSFVIIGTATGVALVAGVLTGVLIFLFSISQLQQAALNKGEIVVNGAVEQVKGIQENVEQTVDSLGFFGKAVARDHDWSDGNATREFLNRTFWFDWNSRLRGNTSIYGWSIRAMYPLLGDGVVMAPQNKTEQIRPECFNICRRPQDPVYTGSIGALVWYDSLINGSKDYVWGLSLPGATLADAYRIRSNPDGSNLHQSDHLYAWNSFTAYKNGSFLEGSWREARLWTTSVDKSTYYYTTYSKLVIDEVSGTHLLVAGWGILEHWYTAIVSVLQVSEKELLMMTQDDGKLMAFSGDEFGDLRLRTCTQNLEDDVDTTATCGDLTAATHYHWYPRAVYSQFRHYIDTVTSEPYSEWSEITESPEEGSTKYLTIVREVWNKDQLRVVATYSIHRSIAIGDLEDQTTVTVILASVIILLSSCLLAAIGVISLSKTHETVEVAGQLAIRIASYDVDGASLMLKEKSTGNPLIDDYFARIIENLKCYRPFLPRALMAKGSDKGSDPSQDTFANHEARMRELEDLDAQGTDSGIVNGELVGTFPPGKPPLQSRSDSTAGDEPVGQAGLVALNRLKTQKFKATRGSIMVVDWDNLPTHDAGITTKLVKIFLSLVIKAISAAGGVVDIIQANRIIGTFNYHSPLLKHAELACKCANKIRAKMAEDAKGKHMNVVIAITTGFNLVGTCGTDEQKSRVVVGESVDMANKMPSLQRSLGCSILVTEGVAMSTPYLTVPVDYIRPTWHQQQRSKTITMYELFPERGDSKHHPLTTFFWKLKQKQFAEVESDVNALLDDENGEYSQNYHCHRLREVLETNYGNWKTSGLGYGRRELAWEPLEGLAFENSGAPSPGDTSAVQTQLTTSLSDVKDATTMRNQLEQAKSTAKTQEKVVEMVEQEDDGGGMLFSIFVANPEPAEEEEETPLPMSGVVHDVSASAGHASSGGESFGGVGGLGDIKEFTDVAGEKWIRTDNALGQGAFGAVYVAIASSTGLLGAVKAVDIKAKGGNLDVDVLVQEVAVLSEYRNEYLAGYVSCGIAEGHFLILMEYMAAGSLRGMLAQVDKIPSAAVQHYTCDILRGLSYLHEKGVGHCDIKPDNVLLSGDGTAKLGDFGSTKLDRKSDGVIRGTIRYMAPEAANGDWAYPCDIFSLGLVMAEMLTGVNPWASVEDNDTSFLMRLSRDTTLRPNIPTGFDPILQSAIEECLDMDPAKRPTAQSLLERLTC